MTAGDEVSTLTLRPPTTASLLGGAVAFWVVMNAWRLSSRLWACALVLTPPVTGLEVVLLPVGLEELPPKMPEVVEPLLLLFDEVGGLLPPNIELPAPAALFPPLEELGGLLLVLGLLPPNMEPPPDGLLDPLLGLLELELRPF